MTFQIPATAKDLTLVYPVDARTHGHPEWIKEPGIARDVRPQPEDAGVASDGAAATGGMTGRAEAGTTASTPGPARFSLGR